MGKALLAFSAPAMVDMFLSRGLTAYTPFTVTAPDRFRRALAMARLSRLAVARWELEPDRSALAVPVFGPGGRVAAAIEVRVDDPRRRAAHRAAGAGHRRPQPDPRALRSARRQRRGWGFVRTRRIIPGAVASPVEVRPAEGTSRSSARPAPPRHGR